MPGAPTQRVDLHGVLALAAVTVRVERLGAEWR
jgi:hypothetical protein